MRFGNRGISRWPLVGGLVLILVLGGGVYLAPDVLGYYRFSQAVNAMSEADVARGGAWPQLHQVCMPCHGNGGDSVNPLYPDLAAQPAPYLVGQMQAFASGKRANPNMSPLAASFSAAEIEQLAAYFAAQPAVANTLFQTDPALRDSGRALVERRGCAACHGAEFAGQGAFPRLAGQGFDYLIGQLRAYRDGTRTDPTGAMPASAAELTNEDIQAMAHYLAGLGN